MSSNASRPKRHSHNSDVSESQILPSRPIQAPASTPPTREQQHSTSTSSTTTPPNEEQPHDLPLSMSTSLLLASPSLPTDARTALSQLATTLDPPTLKVAIRFHAIQSAPQLKQKVFKISASSKFGAVVAFLRKRLYGKTAEGGDASKGGNGGAGQGLFCYVNSVFAPGTR